MRSRQVNGVTIVDLSSGITLSEGSAILRQTVSELLSQGRKQILLNFGAVDSIDSSGIGELVSAYTSVCRHAGQLKLLNLREPVRDLLQITKLDAILDINDDEAMALASFSNP